MVENNDVQRIKLLTKHSTLGQAKSSKNDGFVTFAVGSRYKLLETIGTGAYGVVCSAVDTKTNTHVAIKKIVNPFDILTTAKRTLRELKLLLHFKHDNVVGIKNIIQSNQTKLTDVYLVMDLMESDLHHIIRSDQPLTAEHVCYFMYQLLRGLKYVHSANVIHRDLKPSNLLVNENCELKIGDFGMARAVSSTPEDHKMFMTEYVATRWYRAPELMLSIGDYSQAIDMWSVGCIFAEMMGRKQIFPGHHYVHQLHLVISVLGSPATDLVKSIRSDRVRNYVLSLPHREPVKFNTLYPKASEQMLELLQSFLQFDPAKRPTAEQTLTHSFFTKYHDVDDEPKCPTPFDFRFESTVTKDEVRNHITSAIEKYRDRKTRLSKQLVVVCKQSNKSTVPTTVSNDKVSERHLQSTSCHTIPSTSTVTSSSIFKKPPTPTLAQKSNQPKMAEHPALKPSSDDIDMKSASSTCSMDISVELDAASVKNALHQTRLQQVNHNNTFTPADSSAAKTDGENVSKPMITVQVVQDDSTIDLTQSPLPLDEGATKQTNRQKKEVDKSNSKKSSVTSNLSKKTTISENTKMKIRDSIFANMFAKQKGLGKPLEKVRKSVTAAERQREREEKRKKRQERAAEKERKKEEEARKKNELSDADKSLLDRWTKMQDKTTKDVPKKTNNRQMSTPETTKSDKSAARKGVERHKSLPPSMSHAYRQQNKLSTTANRRSSIDVDATEFDSASSTVQPNNNQLITVLLSDVTRTDNLPPNTIIVSGNSSSDQEKVVCVNTQPVNYVCSVTTAPSDIISTSIAVLPSFHAVSYSVPQYSYSVPPAYPAKSRDFIPEATIGGQRPAKHVPGLVNHGEGAKVDEHSIIMSNPAADTSRMIAAEGGVFIPEGESSSQGPAADVSFSSIKTTRNGMNRPTSLFNANDSGSKVTVLVGNELLTPGKALQQSNAITTPQGRNLATLSPDTIDLVLNEEFQKRTNIETSLQTAAQNTNSVGSNSTVISVNHQRPTDYSLPAVNPSLSYKSLSSSQNSQQHFSSTSTKLNLQNGITDTGSSSNSGIFKQIQDILNDKTSHSDSSVEFSPGSFLKSLDASSPFSGDKPSESNLGSTSQTNGGVFVPHIDNPQSHQDAQYASISMSDGIPSAGAVSAVGYGLGVDIADIFPQSAGEAGSNMDFTSGDQSDSSLLADWINVSCLRPQDMEALQRELELGSPMCVDEN